LTGIFLQGFKLKFFGILLQSILIRRLRKAGGKATGALCLGAAIVGFGIATLLHVKANGGCRAALRPIHKAKPVVYPTWVLAGLRPAG